MGRTLSFNLSIYMKQITACLLLTFLSLTTVWSQQTRMQLFEQFKDALVIGNNGNRYMASVNFDYAIGEFVFIDKSNRDLVKQFADPAKIRHIKIGERFFLPTAYSGSPTEIISVEPHFHIHHRGIFKNAPKPLTYGGSTQTASVDSYTGNFRGSGLVSAQKLNNKTLERTENEYEVKIGKRTRSFSDRKSFLKLFPKSQRTELETYIDKQKIDFLSPEQAFQLYKYAIGK